MKKVIALLLIVCTLLPTLALAEAWQPFGISAEDDYQTAADKLVAAMKGQNPQVHSNFVDIKPSGLTLNGLTIKEITLNRPGSLGNPDAPWRLLFIADLMTQIDNMAPVYSIYTGMLTRQGEPVEVSPMIKKMTFDGVEERSPFDTEAGFRLAVLRASAGTTFKAKFDTCELDVYIYSDSGVGVHVILDQKK